jgi:hypothetical protein
MINHSKERLELVEKIKSKIQEEIDSNINHYKSYLRENVITNLLFKQICFNVTAISNLENFINLPYAFLEIYESNLYRLENLYFKIMLEESFNVVNRYIFLCQDYSSIIPITDEMFSSFEFINVFDSMTYKEKHKEEFE